MYSIKLDVNRVFIINNDGSGIIMNNNKKEEDVAKEQVGNLILMALVSEMTNINSSINKAANSLDEIKRKIPLLKRTFRQP